MVVQYPHTLTAIFNENGATKDANGDWITTGDNSELSVQCRAESSTSDGYIIGSDGQRVDFSWIVYMSLSAPVLMIGSQVTIETGSEQIRERVKRFSKGQLNCRLWL